MEERLHNIFININEWLKFAETKNAAITAANAALLVGALQIAAQTTYPPPLTVIYIAQLVLCTIVAIVAGIGSFLPTLTPPKAVSDVASNPITNPNLLYFGDAATYEPRAYLEALYIVCNELLPDPAPPLEDMYARQIVANSQIASRKYAYFQFAVWLTVAALLTPIGAGILYYMASVEVKGRV